ncbi:MAG: homoserine O-succinyltransferase [Bacteroidales bacterium]|nr:homoserine O-succinyltransferase [Bacteroidales bacterium]
MPIRIPDTLPARKILESENVFVMSESRALSQDIRPLNILILNLMPVKTVTETQLLRVLSNTPLQVNVELLKVKSHVSRNTSEEHLTTFYKNFDDVRSHKYDGLIITGAPVEQLAYEEVDYWNELVEIMDWSKQNVTNTLHICWGAQAGLYHHYGIQKHATEIKQFGLFKHIVLDKNEPLMRGFDDVFIAPHSRHTTIRLADIEACKDLHLLAVSDEVGPHIIISADRKQIFVVGHAEYDRDTLSNEYKRDVALGLPINKPAHYFPNDDADMLPQVIWRAHAHLLYSNWLNYYVYQTTPYIL